MKHSFHSNGKLLLSGEYVVLDGALALAIPTQYGQSMIVEPIHETKLIWTSYDSDNSIWFEHEFHLENKTLTPALNTTPHDRNISDRLLQILNAARQLNSNFLNGLKGFKIESRLSFPKNWGLGSSSTLINNIANWAKVNPYQLLEQTFGGSGYDIACADYNAPITYQLRSSLKSTEANKREITEVDFNPRFRDCIYFVYLNKKQDSRAGIATYNQNKSNLSNKISEISTITSKLIDCKNLDEFEALISLHEVIISSIINQQPVQDRLFTNFNGCVKSLGAWGGDFVMVTSTENPNDYFKSKGYETVIPFDQMVLKT